MRFLDAEYSYMNHGMREAATETRNLRRPAAANGPRKNPKTQKQAKNAGNAATAEEETENPMHAPPTGNHKPATPQKSLDYINLPK